MALLLGQLEAHAVIVRIAHDLLQLSLRTPGAMTRLEVGGPSSRPPVCVKGVMRAVQRIVTSCGHSSRRPCMIGRV